MHDDAVSLVADINADIRRLRARLDELRAETARTLTELNRLLVAAGRRPVDGDDQPALFETDTQPKLWS